MKNIKRVLEKIYYFFFPKKVIAIIDDLVDTEMKKSYVYQQKIKEESEEVKLRTAKTFFKPVEPCESDHQHKWICNLQSEREETEQKRKHLIANSLFVIRNVKQETTLVATTIGDYNLDSINIIRIEGDFTNVSKGDVLTGYEKDLSLIVRYACEDYVTVDYYPLFELDFKQGDYLKLKL
jgi:hypothetical protein